MRNLADIRQEYSRASLDITTVDDDAITQFGVWLDAAVAAGVPEPTAMHLATVNENGMPSSRIVLLKGITDNTFLFFTNYQSRKAKELDGNPACALTFFWPELERQVRIEGKAHRVNESESDAYFKTRPRASQVGAWSSPQSALIKDRAILEARVAQMEKKFEGLAVLPRPHQWGGFAIDPHIIEFWQGRKSRLHDRILYTREEKGWKINRLAP